MELFTAVVVERGPASRHLASLAAIGAVVLALASCTAGREATPSTAAAVSTPASTAPPSTAPEATRSPSVSSLAGIVVVVDPGHNGANATHAAETKQLVDAGGFSKACNTAGTADSGYTESRFNWEESLLLRAELQTRGATVELTRADDDGWGPCIDRRGLTAAEHGADLLISIHADGAAAGDRGFHIAAPLAVAGYTDATAGPSSQLSTAIRDRLVASRFEPSNYAGRSGQIQRDDLGTLNRAGVPAVLIECGNMHDPADLAMLRSPAEQQELAVAIADGVADYVGAG